MQVGGAGAISRGDSENDGLLVEEEEVIPGVGDRVKVVVASGVIGVTEISSNGTMQTGGTGEGEDGAGHGVAATVGVEIVAFVKEKIFSSKLTRRKR